MLYCFVSVTTTDLGGGVMILHTLLHSFCYIRFSCLQLQPVRLPGEGEDGDWSEALYVAMRTSTLWTNNWMYGETGIDNGGDCDGDWAGRECCGDRSRCLGVDGEGTWRSHAFSAGCWVFSLDLGLDTLDVRGTSCERSWGPATPDGRPEPGPS